MAWITTAAPTAVGSGDLLGHEAVAAVKSSIKQ